MASVYVGTVGLRIRVTFCIDISGAGTAKIRAEKPDETVVEWTATIEDAVAGVVFYDTQTGDLDQVGTWKINGIWDPTGDSVFYGKTACLLVRDLGEC